MYTGNKQLREKDLDIQQLTIIFSYNLKQFIENVILPLHEKK